MDIATGVMGMDFAVEKSVQETVAMEKWENHTDIPVWEIQPVSDYSACCRPLLVSVNATSNQLLLQYICLSDCADRKNSCNGPHGLIAVYGCDDPYYGSDVRKWCRKSCGLCGTNGQDNHFIAAIMQF